jgi:hypothetical protein
MLQGKHDSRAANRTTAWHTPTNEGRFLPTTLCAYSRVGRCTKAERNVCALIHHARETRWAGKAINMPSSHPTVQKHILAHTRTCAYAFSLQRHASAQHISSVESNHMPPETVTDVHQSTCAQHTEEASHAVAMCACAHTCAQHRHTKRSTPAHSSPTHTTRK